MARIAGVELKPEKRVEIALTYLYGLGRSNVKGVLKASGVDGDKRVKDLTEEEITRLQRPRLDL